MATLFKMSDDAPLKMIAEVLEEDGYPGKLALRVRKAYQKGQLVWTVVHLVFTDGSQPSKYRPKQRS